MTQPNWNQPAATGTLKSLPVYTDGPNPTATFEVETVNKYLDEGGTPKQYPSTIPCRAIGTAVAEVRAFRPGDHIHVEGRAWDASVRQRYVMVVTSVVSFAGVPA